MTRRLQTFLTALLVISLLASCAPARRHDPLYTIRPDWTYADLRALGSTDETNAPSQTLAALYTRMLAGELQIRLDLLDFSSTLDYDIDLRLWAGSGTQPAELKLPASGEIQAAWSGGQPIQNLRLRLSRDPELDTVEISVNPLALSAVGAPFWVQASVTPSGQDRPVSRLSARTDAPPPAPAWALLAFWDTFPAATPSQALRRWNGAHSGPGRERHGLRGLLTAVQSSGVPAVLLDLKTPQALSALDYMDVLGQVRSLAGAGLFILPDALPLTAGEGSQPVQAPGWALARSLQDSRQAAEAFGLPASSLLYAPNFPAQLFDQSTPLPASYRTLLTLNGASPTGCSRWQSLNVLALPPVETATMADQQATNDGPALQVRRALLAAAGKGAASSPCEAPFVLLGGSLAKSTWGVPAMARSTLAWMSAHPWIRFIGASDLLSLQARQDYPRPAAPAVDTQAAQIQGQMLDELRSLPPGPLADLAWQSYTAMLGAAPLEIPATGELRKVYLGQTGHLLAAARWALAAGWPCGSAQACAFEQDTDWDGQPEVILASPQQFWLFESQGGYAPAAFARTASGVHQIVGASWQFLLGMADPSVWSPGQGAASDPGQLLGAFSDTYPGYAQPDLQPLRAALTQYPPGVAFSSPDGSLKKIFTLEADGLTAQYSASPGLKTQIPLVIDPWLRFSADWASLYQRSTLPGGIAWGAAGAVRVAVTSDAPVMLDAFTDSISAMRKPEDPEFNYPPGHFLPFPMGLVEIKSASAIHISIINPK